MAANVKGKADNKPKPSPGSFYLAKVWRGMFERRDEPNWRQQFKLIIRSEFSKCTSELEGVVTDACLSRSQGDTVESDPHRLMATKGTKSTQVKTKRKILFVTFCAFLWQPFSMVQTFGGTRPTKRTRRSGDGSRRAEWARGRSSARPPSRCIPRLQDRATSTQSTASPRTPGRRTGQTRPSAR